MDAQFIKQVRNALTKEGWHSKPDKLSLVRLLENYREPLLTMRVDAYKELCLMREKFRHPKDREYTDFDRKTMLESYVANYTADYELAKGLEELVKDRIEIIKLLLT